MSLPRLFWPRTLLLLVALALLMLGEPWLAVLALVLALALSFEIETQMTATSRRTIRAAQEGRLGLTDVGPHGFDPIAPWDRKRSHGRCRACYLPRAAHPTAWVAARPYGDHSRADPPAKHRRPQQARRRVA